MVRHKRSDSVMLHDSDQTVAVRLCFNGGSEVFRKLTPGSLKLNIKVRGRDQKLEADAKGSRGQGRGRGQNFGFETIFNTTIEIMQKLVRFSVKTNIATNEIIELPVEM